MERSLVLGVGQFAALLSAALAISIAAERIRVPAAVLLVALGMGAGAFLHVQPPFAFGPTVLFVCLPPLIFEGAWVLDLRHAGSNWARIVPLALPGTIFVAFAIAGTLVLSGTLSFAPALLLGAIVSATDPVAVIAVFRTVQVPPSLRAIVQAESLSNDGVAVVLYSVALALATGASLPWGDPWAWGIFAIAGGIAIGALCALPLWGALLATDASEYEVTGTVGLAYVSYLIADAVHASGILATAAAAVTLRALLIRRPHLTNRRDVDVFWNAAAYMVNAVLFLATGLVIDPARALHEPLLVAVALLVVLGSRAVLAWFVAPDMRTRATVFLAGMRGALPLALALALPVSLAERPAIIDAVFATVFVTLVVQGVPLTAFFERIYGDTPAREPTL
jgi:CPA1 family monovalent cation:H+ antiporter